MYHSSIERDGLPTAVDRVHIACGILGQFCELEPSKVQDSLSLANSVRGIARAISEIIEIKGELEPELKGSEELAHLSGFRRQKIIERFSRPELGMGRMLRMAPAQEQGVTMGINMVSGVLPNVSQELAVATIPDDTHIDRLLAEEPCFWRDMSLYSRDYRDGHFETAFPFDNKLFSEGDVQRYLGLVQELSAEAVMTEVMIPEQKM